MEGLPRSQWRNALPTHFLFTIESFSTLASSDLERHETCEFDADEYKWKLAFYPNGNKSNGVEDHLSMYLVLDDDKLKKEIQVSFTFLVFDHLRKKYLSVQDVSCFNSKKTEAGFDKLLPLKMFLNPSNGYLVNDNCTFGADVYVVKNAPKRQSLSMMVMKPLPFKFTWKVEKFSHLDEKSYVSDKFTSRGHDWKMLLYPKGVSGSKDYLSLFLSLQGPETNGRQVIVEYTLRVVDQLHKNHEEVTCSYCFTGLSNNWGCRTLLSRSDLNEATGYLVKDTCILEAEVTVLGSARVWN